MTWITPFAALFVASALPAQPAAETSGPESSATGAQSESDERSDPTATAQDEYSNDQADIAPIIVVGGVNEQERVKAGSRISKKPLFSNLNYASSTGLSGSPGGGFEPFNLSNPTRKRIIRSCESDSEAVSEEVACILAKSDTLAMEGDNEAARDLLRYVSGDAEFSPAERLEGAKRLYALGQSISSDALREEALVRMLRTEGMADVEKPAALRTLVAMALKRQDTNSAIERLEDVTALDQNDAQSLANLAALTQQAGRPGAPQLIAKAIAIRENQGQPVPNAWRDMAKQR